MAVTKDDLNRLRSDVDARVSAISVDVMGALAALSDHADRFNRLENRLDVIDRKVDDGFSRIEHRMDARADLVDRRFDAIDRKFASIDQKFASIDQNFASVDRKFEAVDRKFEAVDRRFDHVDAKIDNRFGWQSVMMATLGLLVVFAEPIRAALGL